MNFVNQWDSGLFEPEQEIVIGGTHFYLNDELSLARAAREYNRKECDYNNRENYIDEMNRYMQENVYYDYER